MTKAASDKPFKQKEHRREQAAMLPLDPVADDPPQARRFGDPWYGEKDGKQWFDPQRLPEIMRK